MHFENYLDVQTIEHVHKQTQEQDEKMKRLNAMVLGGQQATAAPEPQLSRGGGLVAIDNAGGGGFRSAALAKLVSHTQRTAPHLLPAPSLPRRQLPSSFVIDDDEAETPAKARGKAKASAGFQTPRTCPSRSRTPVGRPPAQPDAAGLVLRGGAQSPSVQATSGSATTIDADGWLWGYGLFEHNKLTGV